jgi:hypothetical protein
MFSVKQVSCTMSRTINLGDYNSIRVEWGEVAEVEEGADIVVIAEDLMAEVKAMLVLATQKARAK